MTCSKRFGRLLQASCLALIGTLAIAGCGGSESNNGNKDGGIDGVNPGDKTAVLNLDRSSVALGTIQIGQSGSATVLVTNTGKVASGAITVASSSPLVAATGCAAALAPLTSCTLTIVATPAAVGQLNATISLTANPGAVTALQIAVSATGDNNNLFRVTPASIELGNVAVGVPAAKQTITVTAAATLTDLTITTSGADVSVDKAASTCTAALAANTPCTISVGFLATSSGPKSNAVLINAGGKTVTVPVTATALKPAALVVSPSGTQAFSASVGQSSTPIAFGIANSGDVATGALVVGVTGANAADFTVTNNCLILAPLAGCTVSVVYTPKAVGKSAATLTVTDSGAGASTVSVILDGTGFGPSTLAITPAAGDVGSVLVGQTGAAVAFTVTNTGDAPSGALTTSVSSTEFVVANDTCVGASLAPKTGTCTISIALKPASAGAKTATLTVDGTASDPAVKTLTGVGLTQAKIVATPAALDFGSVRVNTTGTAQVVTVTNQGGSNTGVLSFTKSGQFSAFPITANTCSAALGPGATCTFTVNFAPTAEGSFPASYTVTDGVTSATVLVSGAALPPSGIGIAPKPLTFGETVVGSTTATQSATVTALTLPSGLANTGELTVTVTGDAPTDFKVVTDGCSKKSLLLDATCVLAVAFAPTAAGDRQATLTVTGANGGLDSVLLKGKGLAIVQITEGQLPQVATLGAPVSTAKLLTAKELDFGQVTNLGAPDPTFTLTGYPLKAYKIIVRGPSALESPFPTTTVAATLTNTGSPADFNYVVINQGEVTRPVANPCTGTILTPSSAGATKSGTNAANWSYDSNEQGWTCTFLVEFFPQTGKGKKTAEIKATGSAGGEDKYTLTGESTGPLTLNAAALTFPQDIQIGQSSNDIDLTLTLDTRPNLTLTLKNNGQAVQGPFTMALGGTDAADFRIVGETCSLVNYGATVAPLVGTLGQGQNCTVEVAFTPSTTGAKTGTVTVTASGGEIATATFTANGTPKLSATFAPAKTDFGTVVQTVSSEWKAITISNPAGAATTSQINYSIGGSKSALFATGTADVPASLGTCGVSDRTALAAGQSCTILVQFKPTADTNTGVTQEETAAENPNAYLAVDTGVGGYFEIPLSGTVGSMLTVTPAALDFGNVAEGATSDPKTITIKNVGSAPAPLAYAIDGGPFSVIQTGTTCAVAGAGLAAGATCTIALQMTATGYPLGQPIADLVTDPTGETLFSITVSTTPQAQASATLTGTPVNPANLIAVGVAQTGNVIDLGGVRADGSKSGSAVLTFKNEGDVATAPVQFQWGTTNAGTADGQFLIGTEGGTCIGNVLQPKKTCTVTVTFNSTAVGTVAAKDLRIFATDGSSVTAFSVTATGLSTLSAVYIRTATGANIGFTTLPEKTAVGATTSVDLQFTNGTATDLTGVSFTAAANSRHGEEFATIDLNAGGATGACAAAAATSFNVLKGQSCTFRVSFKPVAAYAANDFVRWVTLVSSVAGAGTMTIMGTVLAPAALEVTPVPTAPATAVSFGEVALNSTKTLPFVVKNVGETATKTLAVSAGTPGVTAYTVDAGCNVALAAGQSCTVNVTVHTAGTLDVIPGTITVTDTAATPTAGTTTATFDVTTTGVLSSVLSLPLGPLDFGTVTVGNASDTSASVATITVKNVNNGQTTGPVAVTLSNTTDFAIATNNCIDATTKAPVTLKAGETCTVIVQFKPESVPTGGVINATLTATSTPGGTATVGLEGTAQSTLYFTGDLPWYPEITTPVTPYAGNSTYWVVRRNTDAAVTTMLKGAALSGTDAALFSVTDDGCYGSTLAGGEYCSVTVRTLPGAVTAEKNAVLTVSDGTSANTATLKLQIAAP